MPSSAAAPEVAFLRFGLVKRPETGYNQSTLCFRRAAADGIEFLYPQRHLSGLLVFGLGGGDGRSHRQRPPVHQPRCGFRPVLLRLRHGGRSAGRWSGRPAQQLVCTVRGQFSDRDRGRVDHGEAAGTGLELLILICRQKN